MSEVATEKLTWEQLAELEPGTVLVDEFDDGIRFLILKTRSHLCGYIGIPLDHPLAGYEYDDLPVRAHGGLTFSREGGEGPFPGGYWWYGWDYGHCDDRSFYYKPGEYLYEHGKAWLVKDVREDSWKTKYDFKQLMQLAEKIKNAPAP